MWARAGRGSSPRLRFREFFFELVDALLQRRQSRGEQAHIEERDIVGGRIKRVAVTEPRGVVDFHVSKAEFLQHARGFRRPRAALAVDYRFLAGIELPIQTSEVRDRLERHASIARRLLARKLGRRFGIGPVLLIGNVDGARDMAAANGAYVFAGEFLGRARIDDLHIRVVQPRHDLLRRDRNARIDFQFEGDGRRRRSLATGRVAGGGPSLDAFVIDTDIATAKIPYRVQAEIGHPAAPAAINDDFTLRIETSRAEDFLDAIGRDEILGIIVTQYARRIADIDRSGDVSCRISTGRANVPYDGVPRDGFGNILIIGDRGRRGVGDMGDLDQKDRQCNKRQTIHDGPPLPSLRRVSLLPTLSYCRHGRMGTWIT